MTEKIQFYDDFELKFKELWENILIKLSKKHDNGLDLTIFQEEKNLFYEKLFVPNSESLKIYNEIYTGFEVWWSSEAGGFSVESVIRDPFYNVYMVLSNSLNKTGRKPKKPLIISLIYDKCLFGNTMYQPNFAVLYIMDIYGNKEELVTNLQNCIS
ncbi:hypothetical protein [Ureibacillus chungkukjangi]|uniref:hypothetical protein n=1 Tax=Ureibacillus chungkukjangi TaxID=1202712 RepID=UPI000D3B9BB4|nr:hypothetical protein [Ureibacillus chungkukjangi]